MVAPGLRTVVEGLDHPEGVCWSPAERLVYAGGEAGQVYRFGLDGDVPDLLATVKGGFVLGLALDGAGAVYVVRRRQRLRSADLAGRPDRALRSRDRLSQLPGVRRRRAAVGIGSGAWDQATGAIVRIDPDGASERVAGGLRFANGLAIAGDWLYAIESAWPRVLRLPLAGGEPEPVVELERVVPDGLAFDADGGLWISCWQPNRVYRLDTAGELETIVDDWTGEYVLTPTNVAFAGDQLEVLLLSSLGGWAVKAIDPGVRGARLNYPAGLAA